MHYSVSIRALKCRLTNNLKGFVQKFVIPFSIDIVEDNLSKSYLRDKDDYWRDIIDAINSN